MIRGKTREVPNKSLEIRSTIHNRFDIEVTDALTGEVKQRAQAENIILNQMWTNLTSAWSRYTHYGSGTATPSAADTKLTTFYSAVENTLVNSDLKNEVFYLKYKIILNEQTAVGVNISEVGVGRDTSSTSLSTKALLMDMNGNPITIAKTSTDIITIYSTIFVNYASAQTDGIWIYGSTLGAYNVANHAFFRKLCGYNDSDFALFPSKLVPASGLNTAGGGVTVNLGVAWNATTKRLTFTANRVGATDWNDTANSDISRCGVCMYPLSGSLGYNYYAGEPIYIPASVLTGGTDIVGEAIGTGDGTLVNFQTDFPLVSSAKIYIDGVEDTSATIDLNTPFVKNNKRMLYRLVEYKDGNYIPRNTLGQAPEGFCAFYDGVIYECPYCDKIGITSLRLYYDLSYTNSQVSMDGITWTTLSKGTLASSEYTITIPSELQHFKYFKINCPTPTSNRAFNITTANRTSDANIHFATPPASGAVITSDYHTDTIAKDANHVFDFSAIIQLGEYTG